MDLTKPDVGRSPLSIEFAWRRRPLACGRRAGRTGWAPLKCSFPVDKVVSYVSRFVTLLPGDLIYTGTPGSTKAMKPGDVVEVEIEGVGVLRNKVAGPRGSN